MIITLKKNVDKATVEQFVCDIKAQGFQVHDFQAEDRHIIGLIGDTIKLDERQIKANLWVEDVIRIATPYKKASRAFHPEDTIIDVKGVKIGGKENIAVIGGPCSVEGEEQICTLAQQVKDAGGVMLRGGAYKPRTSPYAFQGLETEGILYMAKASKQTGLPIVSEIMDSAQIDEFEKYVDVIQIGARNMQNFALLKAVGKNTTKPILLKRGLANTIEEWLMSAEYIMASGNEKVILCERGIRTFEKYTRNTLDLSVIPIVKEKTHLPIIIDPSHATGNWKYIESMSLAAVAAGADGLMIEVHNKPECAWSDGDQCLKPEKFAELIKKARSIAKVIGRDI